MADDKCLNEEEYNMTSTPIRNSQHRPVQALNSHTSPSHTSLNEQEFQHGIESVSEGQSQRSFAEGQRSFEAQRSQCMNEGHRLFEGQRSQVVDDGHHGQRSQTSLPCSQSGYSGDNQHSKSINNPSKPPKEKKSISTKTFAHGLMDVSLLTTHATQLRTVMSNKDHEFYDALIWMICLSIGLQVLSGIFLLTSDFFKTQDKMKDRQNQKKRKVLSFLSLIIVAVNTPLKIMISAFYISVEHPSQKSNLPSFAPSSFSFYNHTEL